MRTYLYSFLATCSAVSLVSGVFGKMPFQFSAMFALMPVFAILGMVFENPARPRSRRVRIAETVVAVIIGVCSVVLAIYGFLGLF